MAMSQILSPHVLTTFYLLILLHQTSSTTPITFRLDLTHVDAGHNFTKIQLFHRAALRSKVRMDHILTSRSSLINQVQVPVRPSAGEYILDLAIGTPRPLPYSAILDSGSDLIWTQCKPCHLCQPQPTPFYDPARSKTYTNISCSNKFCKALPAHRCDPDCNFLYQYGDNSSNQGVLGTETFVFGSRKRATVHNLVFGCSHYTSGTTFNSSGLVGFGRGPLSLISQLGIDMFSYCFTTLGKSLPSPVFFGSLAKLNQGAIGQVQSTRIIRVSANPSFYYISLEGVTMGDTLLTIPKSTFALSKNGTGGMIIDSGTTFSHLQPEGYKIFREALLSHVKLPLNEKNCFVTKDGSPVKNVKFPKLIFHFEGADLELEKDDYVLEGDGGICLTITVAFSDQAIWGNFQQQNFHILYDLEKEKLSFVRAQCEKL